MWLHVQGGTSPAWAQGLQAGGLGAMQPASGVTRVQQLMLPTVAGGLCGRLGALRRQAGLMQHDLGPDGKEEP